MGEFYLSPKGKGSILVFFLSSYEDVEAHRELTKGDFLSVIQRGRTC